MRFRIHPLFFAVGILSAFTGKLFLFVITTLTALLHEFAHAYASQRLGFSFKQVTLMPYGAAAQGNLAGISRKDEIGVLLAGPLVNGVTAVFFVALWWFFPETYAYTDVIVYSSAAVGLVNLLPALPLDGGKILFCILKGHVDERIAERILKGLGIVLSLVVLAAAIWHKNLSLALFGGLLFAGVFSRGTEYSRLSFPRTALRSGAAVKEIAVLPETECKRALRFLREDSYLLIRVVKENGSEIITQDELLVWLEHHSIYSHFRDISAVFPTKPLEKQEFLCYNKLSDTKVPGRTT